MQKLTLNNMEFHAFHGCLPHEKQIGNTYEVSVAMYLDTECAGLSDNLADTVNYQTVYNIVKCEMEISSNLIENVVWRIGKSLKREFQSVHKWEISLLKHNPPLGGKVQNAKIEISL
jgi:dihydroneopterin aldolase